MIKILENAGECVVTADQRLTGDGGEGRAYRGAGGCFGVINVLTALVVVMVSQVYAFETIVTHQTIHFKYMKFIVCQFYLHKPFL